MRIGLYYTACVFRTCSKIGCSEPANRTLTYVHSEACIVIGPLSQQPEPGAHDLCETHADRITPPQEWQIIRLETDAPPVERTRDDLLALADAVREAEPEVPEGRKHGHLTIIEDT